MKIFSKLILLAAKSYKQEWSSNQPSQHNTPVPVDRVGLTTGLVEVAQEKVYDVFSVTAESVGLSTGLVAASLEGAYQHSTLTPESVGLTTGLVAVSVDDI